MIHPAVFTPRRHLHYSRRVKWVKRRRRLRLRVKPLG